MGKVELKVDNIKQEFNPIKVNIEFTIDSLIELKQIDQEFTEGELQDFTTTYSDIIYDILEKLQYLNDKIE